jgi:hypothetical protein
MSWPVIATRILVFAIIQPVALFAQNPAAPASAHRYFIGVGVNEPLANVHLRYTHNDVQSVAAIFQRLGYENRMLLESAATATAVRAAVRDVAEKAGSADLIVTYFSGAVIEEANDLVFGSYGSDSRQAASVVSILEIRHMLETSQARSTIIADGPDPIPQHFANWGDSSSRVSLVVGRGVEKDSGHGEFTEQLLQAMGQADIDTFRRLEAYLMRISNSTGVPIAFYGSRADWGLSIASAKPRTEPNVSRLAIIVSASSFPGTKLSLSRADAAAKEAVKRFKAAGFSAVETHLNLWPAELTDAMSSDAARLTPKAEVVLFVSGLGEVGNDLAIVTPKANSVLLSAAAAEPLPRYIPRGIQVIRGPSLSDSRQEGAITLSNLITPLVVTGANVFIVLDTTLGSEEAYPNDWLWKWGPEAPIAILTATRPKVALSVDGAMSVFARHFFDALSKPGLSVQQLAEEVQTQFLDDPKRAPGEAPLFASPSGPLFVVNPPKK